MVSYRYYDPHMQWSPVEMMEPIVYNRPPYPRPSFIACGEDFTIAVHRDSPDWYSEDEETNLLLCCGENAEGQCGRSLQQQQQSWMPVKLPKRSKAVGLSCGQSHCLALMQSGELFAWGSSQQGQVGNGKRALVHRPQRVLAERPPEFKAAPGPENRPAMVTSRFVEPPAKIVAMSSGFRNSAVIVEVPVSNF